MHEEVTPLLESCQEEKSQPTKILVVDDDHDQVEVLRFRLKKQGYKTIEADCGQRGLALARAEHPDLVVLDLGLPDADGLTICTELADDPTTAGTPVIIVSGMVRPDIIRQSRAAGCSYYVRKPYDPNALLILIEQAIRESEQW
jgi:CheY-like chemotaxis protein